MPEFDKTKKAIGITKMDESDRKQMFSKFVEAGGQVLKEKPDPEPDDPKKQRPAPKIRQGNVSRNETERNLPTDKKDSSGSSVDPLEQYEKEISGFFPKLAIKFKCWLAKVTPFGTSEVNTDFLHDLATTGKEALMECHYMGVELLTNQNFSPKISQNLDQTSPILVELIALCQKLYNGPEINRICDPIIQNPDSRVPLESIREPLHSLFKRMYILYPHQETLKKAISQGYDQLQKLENKPAMIYNSKKKKIFTAIDTLFEKFFERLYLLVIRLAEKNIPCFSRYMEGYIHIIPSDRPGSRQAGSVIPDAALDSKVGQEQKAEETQEDTKEAEAPEETKVEEKPALSKEQTYGLRLMQISDLIQFRKKFDSKGEFALIPDSDKAYLSYLFFREFDLEYSLVMTTKKISIKPVVINGNKVDYRLKMLDIYEETRTIADHFKEYLEVMRELQKHKENPGSNYIEASKKLSQIENKRTTASRSLRNAIKDMIQKTRDVLLDLIKDMKTKKEIVGNMDEPLLLEAMEAKKKLNRKAVKQAIMDSYCYTVALFDRIESGDFYGGLSDLTPEQMKESFGIDILPDSSPSNPENAINPNETNQAKEQKTEPKLTDSTKEEDSQDLGNLS